jgi:hypothetical protein
MYRDLPQVSRPAPVPDYILTEQDLVPDGDERPALDGSVHAPALLQMSGSGWPTIDGRALGPVTAAPFEAKAKRAATPPLGYLMTTEVCHLSCVMCHFNGPKAIKKARTLAPELVRQVLESQPRGGRVTFVATGEFFSDPNALLHLRTARDLGLVPRVITHGQLLTPAFTDEVLEAGVREVIFSVDAIDARQYARIRRGGELQVVLDACAHLRRRKATYPDLRVGVSAICFAKQFHERAVVEAFWRDRVDHLQFVSEYHDIFHLRRLFSLPEKRGNCELKLIPVPSGRVAPCCAIAIYAHDEDVSWLPHLERDTPEEAYRKLCDLYDDPNSPLSKLCAKCDWWTQFHTDARGNSPICSRVQFDAA